MDNNNEKPINDRFNGAATEISEFSSELQNFIHAHLDTVHDALVSNQKIIPLLIPRLIDSANSDGFKDLADQISNSYESYKEQSAQLSNKGLQYHLHDNLETLQGLVGAQEALLGDINDAYNASDHTFSHSEYDFDALNSKMWGNIGMATSALELVRSPKDNLAEVFGLKSKNDLIKIRVETAVRDTSSYDAIIKETAENLLAASNIIPDSKEETVKAQIQKIIEDIDAMTEKYQKMFEDLKETGVRDITMAQNNILSQYTDERAHILERLRDIHTSHDEFGLHPDILDDIKQKRGMINDDYDWLKANETYYVPGLKYDQAELAPEAPPSTDAPKPIA